MTGASQGLALNFGELTLPIECLDKETEQRLRAQLKQGAGKRVTLAPAPSDDQDVEGHTFAASLRSVLVHVRVGDAGQAQAVRVHFPTAEDADHFRRNLIATGVLAGTLALGSIGVATLANSGAGAGTTGATQVSSQVADESGSVGTAHGYYVQEAGSAGTAHGYFVQQEGSAGTAHGYFEQQAAATTDESVVAGNPYSGKAAIGESLGMQDQSAVSGSQGTAHGYFEQQAAATTDESVVAGNPYSGKAAIGESLGLQGSAMASDELAAQVTDGWAASMPAAPTSDELAAQVTDGWAASGVGQAADESAVPGSQGTAHGYFQQANPAADEESTLPDNPYSGKAAIDESLK